MSSGLFRDSPPFRKGQMLTPVFGNMTEEEFEKGIRNQKSGTLFAAYKRVAHKFFPWSEEIVSENWGITSMRSFLKLTTPEVALNEYQRGGINVSAYRGIIEGWAEARNAVFGPPHGSLPSRFLAPLAIEDFADEFETPIKEKKMDPQVNPDRNEMIALLQGAKGMQFVQIVMNFSRLTDDEEPDDLRPKSKGPALIYKALELDMKRGDVVVVQYKERLGIGRVVKVLTEAPTSDQYDYRFPLRHVIQKIDLVRSAQLDALDEGMLKKITASEAQDRLERMTRQLGIALADISLELPAPTALPNEDDA